MKLPRLPALGAFALAAVLLLARLGDLPLTDPDEGRNASVAREMLDSGDLLVPTYNGVTYLDKPALFFGMVAASMGLFGMNEAAARLPSVLCALALLGLVYAFCCREYGAPTGVLAVVIIGTAPLFFGFGRTVIFDMPLALAVTAAVLAAYRAEHGGRAVGPRSAGPVGGPSRSSGILPWWSGGRWHAVAAAAIAVAVLLKGPVGLIVPGLITVASHVAQSRASRRPGFIRRVFAPLNLAIFFALTLPWFLGVLHRQPDFAQYGLVEETVRRYTTTSFHRTAPWWYYGPVLLATFFPWSALVPEGIVAAWRRRRTLCPADRFLIVWAIAVVAFFSTSQSKLPGYILAAVVALGILTARVLASAMNPGASAIPAGESLGRAARAGGLPAPSGHREPERSAPTAGIAAGLVARHLFFRATLVLAAMALLAAAFFTLVAADPEAARRVFLIRSVEFERLRPAFVPVAVTLAVVAAAAVTAWITRRTMAAFGVFLLFPLSVVTVSFGAIRESIEAGSSRGLAGRVPAGSDVACLECFPCGLPFYLGREVALVTRDGRELTSNYALYKLRQGRAWPATLVSVANRDRWLVERPGPVFLLARKRGRGALDSLAAAGGAKVTELRAGWWGALLPANRVDPPIRIDPAK